MEQITAEIILPQPVTIEAEMVVPSGTGTLIHLVESQEDALEQSINDKSGLYVWE